MPNYVMLLRFTSRGMRAVKQNPASLAGIREALQRWEAKLLGEFHLLGEYDHCAIFDAPDNFNAYRASFEQDIAELAETEILPAIDLPLFQRLMSQTTETAGPHRWQIQWWANLVRSLMRYQTYGQYAAKYCRPLTITGQEKFARIKGPCIVCGNHTSHMDSIVLLEAVPRQIKWNLFSGAAADRWFLKGRKGWTKQPWYQSLVMGSFPVQRGGGSATLDYPKWLIDKGCSLVIFPEGTRSTSRSLAKFKHGVAILATTKNVPVVPIYMTGLRAMRPKGSREITPGPAGAHVLDPIFFPPGTPVPEATRILYEAMNAAHERYQT